MANRAREATPAESGVSSLVVGVDTGGTFTDFIGITGDGRVFTHKTLSTPDDPGAAVLTGLSELLQRIGGDFPSPRVVHGSTVATNAVLERKGVRTAFVTTAGFKDLLHIGRQARRELYNLTPTAPTHLIPSELCFEVDERIGVDGEIVVGIDPDALSALASALKNAGVQSVGIVLLHSYKNPTHERLLGDRLRSAGFDVSISSDILPEHREFERASTTVLNAYVSPLMNRYLSKLSRALKEAQGIDTLSVMQSSGGVSDAAHAGLYGVHTILSGPAGGAVGALRTAAAAGIDHIITFDMGGTSTDVSLVPGSLQMTTESQIEGYPVKAPVIDIHTVGAGGGSIAYVDLGGSLRVGPESAGARPGPACYGLGGESLTVTDANVLLGRLPAQWFLGGRLKLDVEAAERALSRLADQLGASLEDTAHGVIRVVNSNMERAVKVISVEKGHDPRDFALVSFGGAGSLHACDLARSMSIPKVIVPPYPGVLSALGMAMADVVKTASQAVIGPLDGARVESARDAALTLAAEVRRELEREKVPTEHQHVHVACDLRYARQSFELVIPCPDLLTAKSTQVAETLEAEFHRAHEIAYGYAHPGEPIEIVAVRVRGEGRIERPPLPGPGKQHGSPKPVATCRTYFTSGWHDTPIYEREALGHGAKIMGPAIIAEDHATLLVPPGDRLAVHPSGALMIDVA